MAYFKNMTFKLHIFIDIFECFLTLNMVTNTSWFDRCMKNSVCLQCLSSKGSTTAPPWGHDDPPGVYRQ